MFNRIILYIILLFINNTIINGWTDTAGQKTKGASQGISLSKKIDAIVKNPALSSASIGIKIVSLDDGKILYKLNEKKLFHPASNQKLLLTTAGLHLLSPDFHFRTYFGTDGLQKDSILEGNLIVQGRGDPLIITSDLDSVAAILYRAGIRIINGDIIGNIAYFDSIFWGKGWMWDDEPYIESPYLSPLSIERNAIKFVISPGLKNGDTLIWRTEPQTSFVKVNNQGFTSLDTFLPRLSLSRQTHMNNVTIHGTMSPADTATDMYISVWKTEEYFLHLLRERLAIQGIACRGLIDTGGNNYKHLFTSIEHPIDTVIYRINKESDNLASELLLKTLSAELNRKAGTTSEGIELIKGFIQAYGIDTSNIFIADGSGASWYNTISPQAVIEVLQSEYKEKFTFHRFFGSLPVAGTDGTLKKRMRKRHLEGNVHAKTGSLTGVSCISGYVKMKTGAMAAFSIMVNHFTCDQAVVRKMQDEIIEAVALTGRK